MVVDDGQDLTRIDRMYSCISEGMYVIKETAVAFILKKYVQFISR